MMHDYPDPFEVTFVSRSIEGSIGYTKPVVSCEFRGRSSTIKGIFRSFKTSHDRYELAAWIEGHDLKHALDINEFLSIAIIMDGSTLTTRDIEGGWRQRREITAELDGMLLLLSVSRGDK